MPNSIGNVNLDITLNKDKFAQDVIESYNGAIKKIDDQTVTYHIAADDKQLKKMIQEIEKKSPEITAGIRINFDTKQFENRLKELESYVGKSAQNIGVDFSKSLNASIDKNINKNGLTNIIKDLTNDIKSNFGDIKFDINQAGSLDELKYYVEKLTKLNNALELSDNFKGFKISGFKMSDFKKQVQEQLASVTANIGTVIEAKSPEWITGLKELADIDFNNVKTLLDLLKVFREGIGNGSGNGLENLEQNIKDTEVALDKARQKAGQYSKSIKELKRELSGASTSFIATDEKKHKQDKVSMANKFQKAMQEYLQSGGDLGSIDNRIIDLYNKTEKYTKDSFIPLDQIRNEKELAIQEVSELENKLIDLRNEFKAQGGTEIGTIDEEAFKVQKEELEKIKQTLEESKTILEEVNNKYKEQCNLVEELENKVKILNGINDPKVVESEEYKQLTTELENAKNKASEYEHMLDSANDQIEYMDRKLQAFNNNDVVPREDWENASKVIDAYYEQIKRLKDILEETRLENEKLSQLLNTLQDDNISLKEQLEHQKSINESQKEQISNLEKVTAELNEGKKKYKELLDVIKEVELKQKQAMNLVDDTSKIEAFNKATKIVNYNEGIGTPDGFEKFDYLDKIQEKMQETGNIQEKLIKLAVYYNQYLQNSGKERVFNQDGKDISDILIEKYKEMSAYADKNGQISQENAIAFVRESANKLKTMREELEAQKKLNAEKQKELKLLKDSNNEEKTTSSSTKQKTQKDEEQFNQLNEFFKRKQQEKQKSKPSENKKETTKEDEVFEGQYDKPIKVKVIPDTSNFKKEADEQLSKIDLKMNVELNPDLDTEIDKLISKLKTEFNELFNKSFKIDTGDIGFNDKEASEIESIQRITKEVNELATAINKKTKEIVKEENQMTSSSGKEVNALKHIIDKVKELSDLIDKIPNLNIDAENFRNLLNAFGTDGAELSSPVEKLSEEWQVAFKAAKQYNNELSDTVDITKMVRTVKNKDGKEERLISYRVKDDNGKQVTVGKNGNLISDTDKIYTGASDKVAKTKEIYKELNFEVDRFIQLKKQIAKDGKDASQDALRESEERLSNIYELQNRINKEGLFKKEEEFAINNKLINLGNALNDIDRKKSAKSQKKQEKDNNKKYKQDLKDATKLLNEQYREWVKIQNIEVQLGKLNPNVDKQEYKALQYQLTYHQQIYQSKKDELKQYDQIIAKQDELNKKILEEIEKEKLKEDETKYKINQNISKKDDIRVNKYRKGNIDDSYNKTENALKRIFELENKIVETKRNNSKSGYLDIPKQEEEIRQLQELIQKEKDHRNKNSLTDSDREKALNELRVQHQKELKTAQDIYNNSLRKTIDLLHEQALVENAEFDKKALEKKLKDDDKLANQIADKREKLEESKKRAEQKELEKKQKEEENKEKAELKALEKKLKDDDKSLQKQQKQKFEEFEKSDKEEFLRKQNLEYDKLEAKVIEYGELKEKTSNNINGLTQDEIDKLNELEKEINDITVSISKSGLFSDKRDKKISDKLISIDKNSLKKYQDNLDKLEKDNKSSRESKAKRLLEDEKKLVNEIYQKRIQISKLDENDEQNEAMITLLREQIKNRQEIIAQIHQEEKSYSDIIDQEKRLNDLQAIRRNAKDKISENKLKVLNNSLNTETKNQEKLQNAINETKKSMDELEQKGKTSLFAEEFSKAQTEIEEFNNKLMSSDPSFGLKEYNEEIKRIKAELSKKTDVDIILKKDDIEDIRQELEKYAQELTEGKFEYENFNRSAGKLTGTFKNNRGETEKLTVSVKELKGGMVGLTHTFSNAQAESSGLDKLFNTLGKKFRDLGAYLTSFVGFYEIWGAIKQGVGYVKDFDSALTEMRKVSDETVTSLREYQKASFDVADSVGATALEIQSSTADWQRLGYAIDEANELSKLTNIYKNVGDNMNIEDATSSMVSTLEGFQLEAEKAKDIVDIFNEVSNSYAIDSKGIGDALQRSAASFNAANTGLEESVALITATMNKKWLCVWKHIQRIHLIAGKSLEPYTTI